MTDVDYVQSNKEETPEIFEEFYPVGTDDDVASLKDKLDRKMALAS